ncbi:MAG: T9SS type A sorting domain-containing protein [Saprospiraceae bacterium]
MKTYHLSFLFLIILNQNSFSQLSEVFPTENASWSIDYLCYNGGPSNIVYGTRIVTIGGDTMINNEEYTLYYYHDFDYPTLVKIVDQKVYFKETHPNFDTTTYLGFDFGLEVGETFVYPVFPWADPDSMTVEAIDTVQFLDGIKRKRLKLNKTFENICGEAEFWVEGIGAMPNPFYFYNCFECSVSSFSFYQNGELVWYELILNDEDIIQEFEINIFPNPISNYIKIISNEIKIDELTIIDLTGREVYHQIVNENNFEIPFSQNFSKGIYFLHLKLDNQSTVIRKLIKN